MFGLFNLKIGNSSFFKKHNFICIINVYIGKCKLCLFTNICTMFFHLKIFCLIHKDYSLPDIACGYFDIWYNIKQFKCSKIVYKVIEDRKTQNLRELKYFRRIEIFTNLPFPFPKWTFFNRVVSYVYPKC